jgi:hypothetical protein
MAKNQNPQNQQKAEEQKKKAAEGTTKPLPVGKPATTPEEKKMDEENVKKAKAQNEAKEAIKRKMEELKKELKQAQEKEKKEKNSKKEAKENEKKLALAERAKKEEEIALADAAVAKAQRELEYTEEWSILEDAKKHRASIGPLPKLARAKGEGRKSFNGLTPNMIKVLEAMDDGNIRTASEIADSTGIQKGKKLPQIVEGGLLEELVPEEGVRGKRFKITAKGREELKKAKAQE